MKPPFEWDCDSDQPKIILDKAYKRRMRSQYWPDYLKMAVTAALALPAAWVHMALAKPVATQRNWRQLVGVGVNLDKGPAQFDLVDELGAQHVLIRVPLWDMGHLQAYREFASEFHRRGKTVLMNVLQDREHIENPALLTHDMHRVFEAFGPMSQEYQIGNAINRVKWGFFAVAEYLQFFRVIAQLRDQTFPGLQLLGPSVIDFEYHVTARALWNGDGIRFDRLCALLYVDRMGAPANRQYGVFNTDRKMRFLQSLGQLAPKLSNKEIYITEVNWPLSGTAPFAPTSEKECVSEDQYASYMLQYLETAAQCLGIGRVYWHQLIAPGYGLVDSRGGELRKRPAFHALAKALA